jgi:hypothetical protein
MFARKLARNTRALSRRNNVVVLQRACFAKKASAGKDVTTIEVAVSRIVVEYFLSSIFILLFIIFIIIIIVLRHQLRLPL